MEEAQNGSAVTFEETGETEFAVIRTNKDRYGSVTGLRVVSDCGEEFDVVDHNGQTCLTDEVIDVPEPVGEMDTHGPANWFAYEVGGYTIQN